MRVTKAIKACFPCLVLRDQREDEKLGWDFRPSRYCAGTRVCHLPTGDYTLEGFEEYLSIERKGSVDDFVQSMAKVRFRNELERMSDIPHPFVILEFPMESLADWPRSSHLTSPRMRMRLPLRHPGAAFAKYLELKLAYPHVDFTFAGTCGKKLAGNIFKRVIEAYAAETLKS